MIALFLTNILRTRNLAHLILLEVGGQGGYTMNLGTGLPDPRAQTVTHLCLGSLSPQSPDLQVGAYILRPHGDRNSSTRSRHVSTCYVLGPALCMGIERAQTGRTSSQGFQQKTGEAVILREEESPV